MRSSLVHELLEHLLVCGSSLMIGALFVPYGQGLGRTLRNIERQAASCRHDFSSHSKGTVSATLSRLKKKGLTNTHGSKKKAAWFITESGKKHFQEMKSGFVLPPEDGKVRLVVFDIPEEMASHRVWLRSRLVSCDYAPFQKSVWVGARPLPAELTDELKQRKIASFVKVVGLEGLLDSADTE